MFVPIVEASSAPPPLPEQGSHSCVVFFLCLVFGSRTSSLFFSCLCSPSCSCCAIGFWPFSVLRSKDSVARVCTPAFIFTGLYPFCPILWVDLKVLSFLFGSTINFCFMAEVFVFGSQKVREKAIQLVVEKLRWKRSKVVLITSLMRRGPGSFHLFLTIEFQRLKGTVLHRRTLQYLGLDIAHGNGVSIAFCQGLQLEKLYWQFVVTRKVLAADGDCLIGLPREKEHVSLEKFFSFSEFVRSTAVDFGMSFWEVELQAMSPLVPHSVFQMRMGCTPNCKRASLWGSMSTILPRRGTSTGSLSVVLCKSKVRQSSKRTEETAREPTIMLQNKNRQWCKKKYCRTGQTTGVCQGVQSTSQSFGKLLGFSPWLFTDGS